MGKIFEYADRNNHFQIEVTANRNKTFFKSTFISNCEIIEYSAGNIFELFGRLLKEIGTHARILKIQIDEIIFNEEDIKKNELRIVNDKVFVNIDGKHKEFNIGQISDIEMINFSDEQYVSSLEELRVKVNSLYSKLDKKKENESKRP